MRAGFFSEIYHPIVNGVVASIDALRVGLHARGVPVTTFAPFPPRYANADSSVIRLKSLPLPTSTGYRLCVPLLDARARAALHDVDVLHAHSPFVTGWTALAHARRHRLPLVFTYHTRIDAYAHYAPFAHALTRAAMVQLTRAFANAASAVIVPTNAMKIRLRELGVRSEIVAIPSGIDAARFAAGRRSDDVRAALGAGPGDLLALAVARLGREKGLELAIDALARAPGVRLALVGDGPHRPALTARAIARGVAGRVRFAGALPPAALPGVYASADAFVFTSRTDTQGLVLAEALAAGLPVVAVDAASSREVLGDFGRLVPPDADAVAAALTAALAGGRQGGAPADAAARFSPALQAERVQNLYAAVSECRTFGTPGAQNAEESASRPH